MSSLPRKVFMHTLDPTTPDRGARVFNPPRRCHATAVGAFFAMLLLLAAPGCREREHCANCGCNGNGKGGKDGAAPNASAALTPEVIDQLVAQASEALLLDEPENFMPPPPALTNAAGETNQVAFIQLAMQKNRRELQHYLKMRYDYEQQLRDEDDEVITLWHALKSAQKKYDKILADRMSDSIVPGKINWHTRIQEQLSQQLQQLRKLEETP